MQPDAQPEVTPAPPETPADSAVHVSIAPDADRNAVLDALIASLDLCSPSNPMGAPVQAFRDGRLSGAALSRVVLQHTQEACQLPARMALGQIATDEAVAQACAHGAAALTAGAAMDSRNFAELARAAGVQLLATVAQLGGPVETVRKMINAAGQPRSVLLTTELVAAASWPPTAPGAAVLRVAALRKVGRNQPCPCGSGKKVKLCCQGDAHRR